LVNSLLAAIAASGCVVVTLATPVQAATNTPTSLACPGVIAVKGGYRLVQNSPVCNVLSDWKESNKFFDLGGFTFTGSGVIYGDNITIRNGILKTNGLFWTGINGTLSNLRIRSADNPRNYFIEAFFNLTVKNSTFKNIPGIALDFYYDNGGTVRNSIFTGNGTAISIQKSSNVLIDSNTFTGNTRGVNLYDEDGGGVNNNTISHNVFRENKTGITINATPPTVFLALQGNKIINNTFLSNGYSGININLYCLEPTLESPIICPAQDTLISWNTFTKDGFALPSATPPVDDGVTARANLYPNSSETSYPAGLAGITLSNNRADNNADLGFDVAGVTDGGGNIAKLNGDPAQCDGLDCAVKVATTPVKKNASLRESLGASAMAIPEPIVELEQFRHTEARPSGF